LISTQIKLEFYQRRKRQWPIPEDTAPWEGFLFYNFSKVWVLVEGGCRRVDRIVVFFDWAYSWD